MRNLAPDDPFSIVLFITASEGAFDLAEPHLLAAGKRDSARLLAQMMFEWWQGADSSSPGPFAIRGTFPWVLKIIKLV